MITLLNKSSTILSLPLLIVDSMDYNALVSVVSFAACEDRKCENITVIDDGIPEPLETFNVTLEETLGLDDRITLDAVVAIIEIIDSNSMLYT